MKDIFQEYNSYSIVVNMETLLSYDSIVSRWYIFIIFIMNTVEVSELVI